MELFFSPFACSLASHIACREAGLAPVLRRVTLASKEIEGGGNFFDINPKGQVPALRRDDGVVLTEGASVLQYIASLAPGSGLMPPAGSDAYWRALEWLNFVSSEMHKRIYFNIFSPESDDAARARAYAAAPAKLALVEKALTGQAYLTGDSFTVADAYLLWWLLLAPRVKIDLSPYPAIGAFVARASARPAVAAAVGAEMALLG